MKRIEDQPQMPFLLPSLNPTQEKAATAFLESPSSTVTLVQGPPGTGKTTFMVSVIFRSLQSQLKSEGIHKRQGRRILVTAPSNKAIEVLATRFLVALNGAVCFNVAVIGVQDKLLAPNNDDDACSALSSPLRRIVVYTWIEAMVEDLESLRREIQLVLEHDSHLSLHSVLTRAKLLTHKLTKSIPSLLRTSDAFELSQRFLQLSDPAAPSGETSHLRRCLQAGMETLEKLIEAVALLDKEDAVHELLATANVIFSTLSSAGVSAMKQTKRIDDLFVDEAAAATEPEILIPFHLAPDRMLAAGDPMQLPATVKSRHACDLSCIPNETSNKLISLQTFLSWMLTNGGNVARSDYKSNASVLDGNPYSIVHVQGCEQRLDGGSISNREEAVAVVRIVQELSRNSSKDECEPWHSQNKIRVITFYQGQVALIRWLLRQDGLGKVLVATVDSSQGCEADIVIVSFVRSNGNRRAGFLADDRRINVAITRARHQLACVGDASGTLSHSGSKTLRSLVEDGGERRVVINSAEFGGVD